MSADAKTVTNSIASSQPGSGATTAGSDFGISPVEAHSPVDIALCGINAERPSAELVAQTSSQNLDVHRFHQPQGQNAAHDSKDSLISPRPVAETETSEKKEETST